MRSLIVKLKIFWFGLVSRHYFYLKGSVAEDYVLAITNNSVELALALDKALCTSTNMCVAKAWEEMHPISLKKQTIPKLKQNEKEKAVKSRLAEDLKRERNNG